MLIAETFASPLAWPAAALVGGTLIWTAAIKAVSPHIFRRHLATLGWIPDKLLSPAVTGISAIEAGWGTALLLNMAPGLLLPLSVLAFAGLSAVSWWGVKSGKAADCGCYGGFIQPSIWQSLGFNAVLVALLIASWLLQPHSMSGRVWEILAVLLAAVVAGMMAEWALRYEMKTGKPKFFGSPIKIGAKWRHSWAHGATRGMTGEILVSLLGPDCPFCKQWVRVGNAVIQSPELPKVVGVVGASSKRRDEFVTDHGVRFPVATVSPSLMNRMTSAVPTTMLVVDGSITDIWVGRMPPEFVQRFRRAFFPDAVIPASAVVAEAQAGEAPATATLDAARE